MKYCPACGNELQADGDYCPECGERLEFGESGAAEESDENGSRDETDGSDPVEVKQGNSLWGTLISSVAYVGILIGSFGPWMEVCRGSADSLFMCEETTIVDGGSLMFVPIAISITMLVLLLDDYFQLGVIETWRPRKARLNLLAAGGLSLFLLTQTPPSPWSYQWGAELILVSCGLLLAFSMIIFALKWGFEKHIGFR